MKKMLYVILLVFLAPVVQAQMDADITIYKDARIDRYMNQYSMTAVQPVSKYIYRIQLVSTYQRAEADRTQGGFRSRFPAVQTFKTHDGVKYIVRAGRFENKGDAETTLADVRRYFPSAFILPPEIVVE